MKPGAKGVQDGRVRPTDENLAQPHADRNVVYGMPRPVGEHQAHRCRLVPSHVPSAFQIKALGNHTSSAQAHGLLIFLTAGEL